jgi:hypothetical protein
MTKLANIHGLVSFLALALPIAAGAQVPVDDAGNVIGEYEVGPDASADSRSLGNEDIPLLTAVELDELVGPVALYPDDLLAIVLPAAAYPLQIVEAARFLEALETDPSLKPDPEWDDSVVALLNYPEVVALMNDEIDWTWQLGEAVVAQQADVVSAIESFRDRAYAAGNLKSDEYQTVSRDEGVIEITPVSEEVIYVPYYEPERVVVYQPRPVYFYYPRAYPVYYYPYPSAYAFDRGFFWGVTTAFTVGWLTDSLHVYHHSYYGHPYYGRAYRDYWWYRRPSINVYNTTYVRNTSVTVNRYYAGDRWQPRHDRRRPARPTQPRIMNREYSDSMRGTTVQHTRRVESREPIRFRDRGPDRVRTAGAQSRGNDRDRVSRQVRESRETIARLDRERRQPTVQTNRGRGFAERSTAQRRDSVENRTAAQRSQRQQSRPTGQRQVRSEASPTPQIRARQETRPALQRETRRDSRPSAQIQARRETRPTPQRETRRESRSAVQMQARRETRPTPQRETRRESQPVPQREARRESPPPPKQAKQAKSRQAAEPERKKRSNDRRAAR